MLVKVLLWSVMDRLFAVLVSHQKYYSLPTHTALRTKGFYTKGPRAQKLLEAT